jgi:ankyrin repeat protein
LFVAAQQGLCNVVKCLLSSNADINLRDEGCQSPLFASSMSGHCDASSSRKLISAPELSKHFTTSQCPRCDASNNGDCPKLLLKLISAPELSKHLKAENHRCL